MSAQKFPRFALRSNQDGLRRFAQLLRKIHPHKTADAVAADTKISVGTIRRWLALESAPHLFTFMVLVGKYGPEVVKAFYADAPDWLSDAYRTEQLAYLTQQQEAAQRAIEELR